MYPHEFDFKDGRHVCLTITECMAPSYNIRIDGVPQNEGREIGCVPPWNKETLERDVRKIYEN
jgi:hypothetical protein